MELGGQIHTLASEPRMKHGYQSNGKLFGPQRCFGHLGEKNSMLLSGHETLPSNP